MNNIKQSEAIPEEADEINISLQWAEMPGFTVEEVRWIGLSAHAVFGDLIADSAALKFIWEIAGNS